VASAVQLRLTGAAVAAAWMATTPVRAQSATTPNAPPAPVLEQIVVTADRKDSYSADFVQAGSFRGSRQLDTPLTVNIIPAAVIQSQQAQGLLEALRNTAGVSPAETSTTVYSNVAIRGITVENRSNYRLDGILPIVNLIDIPLEDKDRVEVLKGASALYYGFTTPAGVINLTMKRPTPEPYIATSLLANQYGAVNGSIDAGNTWGPFGARVNAVYGTVDSGIDNTRGHRSLLATALDLVPTESVRVSLDAEHIVKQVNEPGVFRYIKVPAGTATDLYPPLQLPPLLDPTTNFAPDWASNRAEERNVLASVSWQMSRAWQLSASYGTSHLVRDRNFSTLDLNRYGANTDGNGLLSIRHQPGASFDNSNYRMEFAGVSRLFFTTHQLLFGASQNIRDAFNSTSFSVTCPGATAAAPHVTCTQNVFHPVHIPEMPFPPRTGTRARINDIGYYLFDRMEVGSRLLVLAGVRKADYTETNLDTGATTFQSKPTSISYGAVVKPLQWMSLYGTYIEGLESTPSAPITARNFGATLPATRSTQREAGVKIEARAGLLLQAAYFDIERDSAFLNGANLYVLDGRARFRGTEISVTGEVTPDWSVYATAQFLSAKQISAAATVITTNSTTGVTTVVPTVMGRKIENAPERTVSVASEYRLRDLLPGFSVNGAAYYISERAVNAFNQAFIPAYTLYDFGAAYTGKLHGNEITVRLTAQNITGKKYFSSTGSSIVAQGPPRMLKISVSARLSGM
jgi:iron complex outermembrane recepter protein